MNLQSKTTKKLSIEKFSPGELGEKLSAPIILTTVLLLSVSYISDMFLTNAFDSGIGETSVFSRLLYEAGNLLSKLIYPLISVGIAFAISGFEAIPSGLLGGMIAGTGATFASATANATSISGIFGCILSGYCAGYCIRLINKLLHKFSILDGSALVLITPALSVIFALFAVLIINTTSYYINHYAAILAAVVGKTSGILLSVILGIFMTADSGGPLYLAGYMFSVASITTGEPRYMATVVAAGAIPPLTMGLYTLIYNDRTQGYERLLGSLGIVGGLFGLPHCALAFYTKKTYSFTLSCVPGGIVAALLSFAFNCTSNVPTGGILGFDSFGKPLFFLLALSVGTLISTFILSMTESTENNPLDKSNEDQLDMSKGLSAGI